MLGEGAPEIEADDGREHVGIEGGDDQAVGVLPDCFGDWVGEKEKAFLQLGVANDDRHAGEKHRDDFGEGDDEENREQRDGPARPLEMRVVMAARLVDDFGLGRERLELEELFLLAGLKGHADEFRQGAQQGRTQKSEGL